MKHILILLLLTGAFLSYSQDKNANIQFKKSSPPVTLLLENKGFVISVPQKDKKNISYYNNTAEVKWSISTEMNYAGTYLASINPITTNYTYRNDFMVVNPSRSVIYSVEAKAPEYLKNTQFVTQIDKDGSVKKFKIEGNKELGNNLQTVFCDDNYFYCLASLDGSEMLPNKKSTDKLILNRFQANDFTYNRFVLSLPPIEKGDNTTFWTYLGQTDTEKFLISKNIDYKNDKSVFTIAVFNENGDLTRTFDIQLKLDQKYIRPSNYVKSRPSSYYQSSHFDYKISQGKVSDEPSNGGFCQVHFDENSSSFYVFGLFGPKIYKGHGSEYEGFYIHKFDLKGGIIWKMQQNGSAELINDKVFRSREFPGRRNIDLKVIHDNSLNFSIQYGKRLFGYVIDVDGKVVKTFRKDDSRLPTSGLIFTNNELESENYIKNKIGTEDNELIYSNLISSQGEILFELDYRNENINLFYFKK